MNIILILLGVPEIVVVLGVDILFVFLIIKNNPFGGFIALNGATAGVPYNTSEGFTFSTSVSLSSYTSSIYG